MLSDVEIDAHAWWEAERRAIRSINEWNECLDGMKAAMGEAI